MKAGKKMCFLCEDSSVLKSMNENVYNESEEVKISSHLQSPGEELCTGDNSSHLHILFNSVLRITTDLDNSTMELFNICTKCSKDLISLHELVEEIQRLELLSKTLKEKFINSAIKSLVQISCECVKLKKSEFLIQDAIQNLKKVPVQFQIYKKWRTRFVKTFNSLQEDLKTAPSPTSENMDKDLEENIQTKHKQNVCSANPSSSLNFSQEVHHTFIHDHSYGISLKSDLPNSEAGIFENNKTSLVKEAIDSKLGQRDIATSYKCSECGRKFRRQASLKEHVRNGHRREYSCAKCDTHFLSKHELNKHNCVSHNEITDSDYPNSFVSCEYGLNECSGSKMRDGSKQKEPLATKGESNQNLGDFGIECPEVMSNKAKQTEPIACQYCDKTYTKKRDLKHHLRTHTGERPFTCEYCKKSFLDNRQLIIHVRIHTGEKPYICEQCGTGFSSLSGFHSHRKTHAKLKPFKCEECKGNFRSVGQLQKHLLIHSGEKPFSCTICQKSFNRKENLRIHEYTHTSFKPHKCHICSQSYIRAFLLRNHIAECHSDPSPTDDEIILPLYSPLTLSTTSTQSIIPEVYEDQVEIVTYDTLNSRHPQFGTTSTNNNSSAVSIIPETVYVANNGEQYIIFN